MLFQYTGKTWFILIAMVATGATRQLAVKTLYQTGFEAPIYVTLLYLLGQSLSLVVYGVQRFIVWVRKGPAASQLVDRYTGVEFSGHGLLDELEEINTAKVGRIPYWVRPIIPGFFNMLNSLMRWASLVYVAASISEMLISGLELTLSVVAARLIRQRLVSRRRWLGVGVVVVGLTLIGVADVLLLEDDDSEDATINSTTSQQQRENMIGLALIVGQCILSVLQDIAEEMFMQTGDVDYPPLLLLGMEGAFGFAIALFLFVALGDTLGNSFSKTVDEIQGASQFLVAYSVDLTLLFTITGIFNIKATQMTSAMTRNVWKNLRTVVVWALALLIFYLGGESFGEPFVIPQSLLVLAGFAIMVVGIFLYYSQKAMEEQQKAKQQQEQVETIMTTDEDNSYSPEDLSALEELEMQV